ncbi:hypothetical protein ADK57_16745 [Streptomyces sp. MMG1533]|uniref:hypothetical protein n=1 Tax=Streptomyces sp. MMG1533 TaxID=1415546 RepID=UPI0006ADD255|nr:hypothetical protein [Streptomyces sp. MMG1533]KOU67244.1 hypothetical protein ADK57_16745 [Streptomyces sp. MMG1533]
MKRAIASGAFALVTAATCLVLAPTASAAPDACVTSTLTTGSNEGVGTQVRKSSTSTCGDLNLTYTDDKTQYGYDGYAGRLYHSSSSRWITCDAGYVWAYDGSHSVNDSKFWLCTDVSDNTLFTVASAANGGDTVRITH